MTELETPQKQLVLSLLKSPQSIKCVKHLRSIHVILLRTGLHRSSFAVGNFVNCCANQGLMSYAAQLFDQMPEPNSFVWNTMIRGFQHNHQPKNAMLLFDRMRFEPAGPDCFTFPFVIRACAELMDHLRGLCIHGLVFKIGLELDTFVGTSLIEFYGGFGNTVAARHVFDEMPMKDKVAWTVLLSSFVNKCSDLEDARKLFDQMPDKDLVVWNIMIFQYIKAGDVHKAEALFNLAPVKDLLMYNTVLGAYARNGEVDIMLNSIEVNGEIHEFGAEEKIHPRVKEICEMIDEISRRLWATGHVSSRNEVFFDVEDEEKDKMKHALVEFKKIGEDDPRRIVHS
ncbi:hypothetical protein L6452_37590 [Arctium lappa]|uniref:Uncharacterized protein n=1 Tax=Arctium lappa TaxID=4217 RepID=A0ACB8Y2M9_ARCLA|nr:hypothetical protein L6452_37590 [Arctium lappa]